MRTRSLFPLVALALADCKTPAAPPATPPAAAATHADAGAPAAAAVTAPETLLFTLRGATLRRALPLLFPQGGAEEVSQQLAPQVTPGIASHAREIDLDAPFAVGGTITAGSESTIGLYIAWPLKPGMQIAQDARALHGFRAAGDGLFAPDGPDAGVTVATAPDGGVPVSHQCWVGQRRPIGWMLVCGPREGLASMAGYLRAQSNALTEAATVLDLDLRAGLIGRLARRQLADLDAQITQLNLLPSTGNPETDALRRTVATDQRRSAALFTAVATDVEGLHATLTQDENAMHLRGELTVGRASSDSTRALIAATAGRQAPAALLQALPAAVQSWVIDGAERTQIATALGPTATDPRAIMQFGPEVARVMSTMEQTKALTSFGTRVDAWSPEDGYTTYHVVDRADGAQFLSDLRVAVNSIPTRPVPGGGTLRDIATLLPTPGLTNAVRIGQNQRIPPGAQVTAEQRADLARSLLVVAEPERIVAITARDPLARYRALGAGARLAATVPANAVLAGRVTPPGFTPLVYGAMLPGLPATTTTDGVDFAVVVERRGEGARMTVRADAPIGAATELRTIPVMIDQVREAYMRQMSEAMQRAQQQQNAARQARQPAPELDPSMLPAPPTLQLHGPR